VQAERSEVPRSIANRESVGYARLQPVRLRTEQSAGVCGSEWRVFVVCADHCRSGSGGIFGGKCGE